MAKKKRRYERNKRCRSSSSSGHYDTHHLLWQRRKWKNGALKELRNYYYCMVDIPKDSLHKHIHSCVSYIPVPNETVAEQTLYQLKLLDKAGAITASDPIEKRLKLLIVLFHYVAEPTAEALKKQLDAVQSYSPSR